MIAKLRKGLSNYIPILSRAWFVHAFPSFYNALEIRPSSAVVMITNRCNLRCVMCRQWRSEYAAELSTEDWISLFLDLKANGIRNIHFTGGEVLLRDDFRDLVSNASAGGFVVGMTTNGNLLKKDTIEDLAKAGLRSVALSIDATEAAYEAIRGVPGSFEHVRQALSVISDIRKSRNIDAYINFTLMKNNSEELKRVKDLADRYGLPLHVCLLDKNSSIFNVSDNKDSLWVNSDADRDMLKQTADFLKYEKIKKPASLLTNFSGIDFIKEYFKKPRQERIPCVVSQDRIFIDPSGNMLGGCLSMGRFGNIKDKGLDNLLKDERYRKAKRDMFYKNCAGCSCGYMFNIRHFVPCVAGEIASRIKYSLGGKNA